MLPLSRHSLATRSSKPFAELRCAALFSLFQSSASLTYILLPRRCREHDYLKTQFNSSMSSRCQSLTDSTHVSFWSRKRSSQRPCVSRERDLDSFTPRSHSSPSNSDLSLASRLATERNMCWLSREARTKRV
jgi:hypothetical protein